MSDYLKFINEQKNHELVFELNPVEIFDPAFTSEDIQILSDYKYSAKSILFNPAVNTKEKKLSDNDMIGRVTEIAMKIEQIRILLHETKLHILVISETHLSEETSDNKLSVENYLFEKKDRKN